MRRRAEAIERTRRDIVRAAHRLFAEGGYHDVGVDDIAREAGVVRGTVYYQFGSKHALFDAAIRYALVIGGAAGLSEGFRREDSLEALGASLRAGLRLYGDQRAFLAKAFWLAKSDPEARQAIGARESARRAGIRDLADRLARDGHVRKGRTTKEVAEMLWLLTSFEAFDIAFHAGGMSAERVARLFFDLSSAYLKHRGSGDDRDDTDR